MESSNYAPLKSRMSGFVRFDPEAPTSGPGSAVLVFMDGYGRSIVKLPAVGEIRVDDVARLGLVFSEHRTGDAARMLDEFWFGTFNSVMITDGDVGEEDFAAMGRHHIAELTLGSSGHDPSGRRTARPIRLPSDPQAYSLLPQLRLFAVHTFGFGDGHLAALAEPGMLRVLTLSGTSVNSRGIATPGLRGLEVLWIVDDETIADDLAFLGGMPDVTQLKLQSVGMSDRHLRDVAIRPRISDLSLAHNPVGEGSLEVLRSLRRLRILDLTDTLVSDQTVGSLLAAVPRLEWLTLSTTALSDAAMPKIASLRDLRRLWLARTRITDDGLATLVEGMPQLRLLDVSLTGITSRGVPLLMGLRELQRLEISPRVLTEELVVMLDELPEIREIGLRGPCDSLDKPAFIADTIGAVQTLGGS